MDKKPAFNSADFQLLDLTNNGAPADGASVILASVQYQKNDFWQQGFDVTFQLRDSDSAAFESTRNNIAHTTTNSIGQASVSFYDTKPESGTIYAFLTNDTGQESSKDFNFSGELQVQIQPLINNEALANGKDAIEVTVVVTLNGKKQSGMTVKFEILQTGHAIFTDSMTTISEGKTAYDGSGSVSKYFTNTLAETGEVYVYVKMDSGENPDDTKGFEFTAPLPDKILLSPLVGNGAIANSGQPITATATLTNKGTPVRGQTVLFSLFPEDNLSAQFTDAKTGTPNKTTGVTLADGSVTKSFTDVKWETGTVHVDVDFDATDKPMAEEDFIFDPPPSLKVSILPLTTLTTNEAEEKVEYSKAPADGITPITATALVTTTIDGKDVPWPHGAMVDFRLLQNGIGDFTAKFTDTKTTSTSGMSDSAGKIDKLFTDVNLNTGQVHCTIPITQGNTPQDDNDFAFINPWVSVSKLEAAFSGNTRNALIYANGLHQAKLVTSITLADSQNKQLVVNNQPSWEDVVNSVKLIDYQSGQELGTGTLQNWNYTRVSNVFDKEKTATFEPEHNQINIFEEVSNGVATITYYITYSPGLSLAPISIGFSIAPTGMVIKNSGQLNPESKLPIGKLESAPTLYFSQSGINLALPPRINLTQPIQYNTTMLSIVGNPVPHSGESDDSLKNRIGAEDPGNYWRQWNYQISFSQQTYTTYGTRLHQCRLIENQSLSEDYAFSEKSNIIYNYKAYLWPYNVYDSKGIPLPCPTNFTLESTGSEKQTISFPPNADRLYITLYCTFGNISVDSFNLTPLNVIIYDNYGNKGEFNIHSDAIPQLYDLNTLYNWNMLRDGKSSNSASRQNAINGPIFTTKKMDNVKKIGVFDNTEHFDDFNNILELQDDGERFNFTPTTANDYNNNKIYEITTTKAYKYITYDSGDLKVKAAEYSDRKTWLLKPIWVESGLVIADNSSTKIQVWTPVIATDSKGGVYYYVYLSIYTKNTQYTWNLRN